MKKPQIVSRKARRAKRATPREMTREQVEAWRAGWQAVKELELEEAKSKSVETRWREINMLFDLAHELGLIKPPSAAELAPIRARWARLKANYL